MALTSPTEMAALQLLLGAEQNGVLRLVDAHGHPLALLAALDHRCWAHMRDAQDGKVYVHEVTGSRELTAPRYLELMDLNI